MEYLADYWWAFMAVAVWLMVWAVRGMVMSVRRYDKNGTQICLGDVVGVRMGHINQQSLMDYLIVVPGSMFGKNGLWLIGQRCEHPQCVSRGETYYARDLLTPELAEACIVVGILETVMQDSMVSANAEEIRKDWDKHKHAYAEIDYAGEMQRIDPARVCDERLDYSGKDGLTLLAEAAENVSRETIAKDGVVHGICPHCEKVLANRPSTETIYLDEKLKCNDCLKTVDPIWGLVGDNRDLYR